MIIEQNIPLKDHTTFRIGGPARYFTDVKTTAGLIEALEFAAKKHLDFFILAGGSNLIVSDNGYPGLVIKVDFQNIEITNNKIVTGSGVLIDKLVDLTINQELRGLEWAGGLPGTVGGAVRGNAGAFSGEMKDTVLSVKSITPKGNLVRRNKDECIFMYRSSIYKKNREIILEVTLSLEPGTKSDLQEEAQSHRQYRQERHPLEYPNTGSIFKNVAVTDIPKNILDLFIESKKVDPFPVIPTARILSDAGLKGYKIGQAQISEKHPNYIVNLGGAKAQDVVSVIQYAIAIVMDKYGIQLEVEPQLLGFSQKYPWESQ